MAVFNELFLERTGTSCKNAVQYYFITRRSFFRFICQQKFNYSTQIIRKVVWNMLVSSFQHCLEELSHFRCFKRHISSYRFVKNTPKRPNVTFYAIRLISPHFWTCIKWSASLSVVHTLSVSDFRNVHVSDLYMTISCQEDVRWL